MENTSKPNLVALRDIAYYRQRQKNRVFTALARFFAEEAEGGRISRKELAEKLGKDPSQITRWLSAPSNFELDTISDILLAMGAEMDHTIGRFSDKRTPNYIHHYVERYVNSHNINNPANICNQITSTNAIDIAYGEAKIVGIKASNELDIKYTITTTASSLGE